MAPTSSLRARLALTSCATTGVLAATALLAPPGQAAVPEAASSSYLRFTKYSPVDSRLTVVRHGKAVVTFRASSGMVEKECRRGRGWLPDGTYTLGHHHTAYDADLIKGYAIELGNKRCQNGTYRTELFIHSDMTRNGRQGTNGHQRWDGDGDYRSHGCIKLSPRDIRRLFRTLDRNGWPRTLKVVDGRSRPTVSGG
ncbi:hypothetical protein GCM10020000_73510 [Streptomyces olivoverticillatus]